MKDSRKAKKSRQIEAKPARFASFVSNLKKNFKHLEITREMYLLGLLTVFIISMIAILFNVIPTSPTIDNQELETTEETESNKFRHPLTGELLETEIEDLQVLAIIVENSADALPLSGLDRAFLAIEAPAEGNIPRILAFFDRSTEITKVGPIRSVRPYFLDFAKWFNAIVIHVGGSPEALSRLQGGELRNFNEMTAGNFFYRQTVGRYAPHNVFTNSELLETAIRRREYLPDSNPSPLKFGEDFEGEQIESFSVDINGTSLYRARWTFDSETGKFIKSQGGRGQRLLENGNLIAFDNILIVQTDAVVLDEVGRLRIRTKGEGYAVIFRDGQYKDDLRWFSDGQDFQIEDIFGNNVYFAPGKTWIHIISSKNQLKLD
jgi:hypothetical protein